MRKGNSLMRIMALVFLEMGYFNSTSNNDVISELYCYKFTFIGRSNINISCMRR